MHARTLLAALLAILLVLGTLVGCSGTPEPADGTAATPETTPGETATEAEDTPPLADEERYRALLSVGLERYGLTIEDGTFEVLQSMEGYGAVKWTTDEHSIVVTCRDVDDDWRWEYVDENVDVNSATPDRLTDAERAEYLGLAKELIAAVGKDSSDIAELYTWKAAGGVMQGDYTFGGAAEELQVHISTDAGGHLGYVYLTKKI